MNLIDSIQDKNMQGLAYYYKRIGLTSDENAIMASLVTVSAVLRNKARIVYTTDSPSSNSINLYWLNIAPSIIGRKSWLADSVMKMVQKIADDTLITSNFTFEGMFETLYCMSDKSALLYSDEFRSIVGDSADYKSHIMTDITEAYNGDLKSKTLAKYGDKKGGSATRTVGACSINYIANSTPEWLFKNIKKETVVGGFLNRFVITYLDKNSPFCQLNTDDTTAVAKFQKAIPRVNVGDLVLWLQSLCEDFDKIKQGVMILTQDAKDYLNAFKKNNLAKYTNDTEHDLDISYQEAIINRAMENIRRMGAILQLASTGSKGFAKAHGWDSLTEQSRCEIGLDAIKSACAIMGRIIDQTMQAFEHNYAESFADAMVLKAKRALQSFFARTNLTERQSRKVQIGGVACRYIAHRDLCQILALTGKVREETIRHLIDLEILREMTDAEVVKLGLNNNASKKAKLYLVDDFKKRG
jgi:hypothetical protein